MLARRGLLVWQAAENSTFVRVLKGRGFEPRREGRKITCDFSR
jgi:hypothetical protein